MSDDVRVVVDTRNLDEFERAVAAGALRDIVVKVAYEIEAIAKTLVPVDTGATRGSIFTQIEEDTDGWLITAFIGPTTLYAIFIEYGTYRMAAHPFLRPALEQKRAEFEQMVQQTLQRLVGS